MKLALLGLCIITSLLTGCADFGPMKVGICHDRTCIDFTIPGSEAKASGKEVVPVQ